VTFEECKYEERKYEQDYLGVLYTLLDQVNYQGYYTHFLAKVNYQGFYTHFLDKVPKQFLYNFSCSYPGIVYKIPIYAILSDREIEDRELYKSI